MAKELAFIFHLFLTLFLTFTKLRLTVYLTGAYQEENVYVDDGFHSLD